MSDSRLMTSYQYSIILRTNVRMVHELCTNDVRTIYERFTNKLVKLLNLVIHMKCKICANSLDH
jgi:hypothetical protein